MTLHLEGVHICHIQPINNGFENHIVIHFQPKNEMKILVKMVYLEGICMVEADSHVLWDQFNREGPKWHTFCPRGPSWPYNNRRLLGRDSWQPITTHV